MKSGEGRNRNRILLCVGLIALLVYLLPLPLPAAPDIFTRSPYLQLSTPTSVVLVWRTGSAIKPLLRYGLLPEKLDRTLNPGDISAQGAAGSGRQYEARLAGLQPSTTYYYALFDGKNRLTGKDAGYRFRTAPAQGTGTHVRIWVLGDSGRKTTDLFRIHRAMREYVGEDNHPPDLLVHLGDLAYSDGTERQLQSAFFDIFDETLRGTVSWPTLGNHDRRSLKFSPEGGPYFDAFVLPEEGEGGGEPSGTESYYSFEYGNIHFVSLDSNRSNRSAKEEMMEWLKRDLALTETEWLIAYWHHAPYSKGRRDSDTERAMIDTRTGFMPILEEKGVDLVLSGHAHIYARSMLIDGAYDTPMTAEGVVLDAGDGDPAGDGPYRKPEGLTPHKGTVAVVAGMGGVSLDRPLPAPVMKRAIAEFGSVIIDIKGNRMTGRMIAADGKVKDTFAIVKGWEPR